MSKHKQNMDGFSRTIKGFFGTIKMQQESNRFPKNTVFVIVEAKADEVFFRKFFASSVEWRNGSTKPETKGDTSEGGANENVWQTVKEANENNFEWLIGIIDADFNRLLKPELLDIPNLYFSDGHDKEMMLIAFENVWANFSNQYIDLPKAATLSKAFASFKDFLFQMLKPLTIWRYLNEKYSFGLKFSNLKSDYSDYGKFVLEDKKTKKWGLNIQELQTYLQNKSNKSDFFTKPENQAYIEEFKVLNQQKFSPQEFSEWTNGHDFINILCLGIDKNKGKIFRIDGLDSEPSPTGMDNTLSSAFRFDEFKQTQLYAALAKWEKANTPAKLFP